MKKAYSVTWQGCPAASVVIAATTPGKACYAGYRLCRDVYGEARFFEMRVRRAPEWDGDVGYARHDGRIFQGDGFEPEMVEYWGAMVELR